MSANDVRKNFIFKKALKVLEYLATNNIKLYK